MPMIRYYYTSALLIFVFSRFAACPPSTYKNFKGFAKQCTACPANSGHTKTQSITITDCECSPGYTGTPENGNDCTSKELKCISKIQLGNFVLGKTLSFNLVNTYRVVSICWPCKRMNFILDLFEWPLDVRVSDLSRLEIWRRVGEGVSPIDLIFFWPNFSTALYIEGKGKLVTVKK